MNATGKWFLKRFLILAVMFMAVPHAHAAERITYYHTDALGSPTAATDQQGNVIWRESYEPYGERIKKEPASSNNARWHTGHVLDAETGLQYAGARYYDPVLGRFMGVDPASFAEANPHSFNRYAYGNNNPYKFIDLDGRAGVEFQPGGLVRCAAEGGCRQLGGGGGGAAMQRSLPQTAASPASATTKPTLGETRPSGTSGIRSDAPDIIAVDSKGNALPLRQGEHLTGSKDGSWIQVRDANGNPTGMRIDGPHSPKTHPDSRALEPHAHRPGVTNADGTPWLPINQ